MKKTVFAIFFLLLMVVLGGASIVNYFKMQGQEFTMSSTNDLMLQSFADDYPFKDSLKSSQDQEEKPVSPLFSAYITTAEHIKTGVDAYTNRVNPLAVSFLTIPEWIDEHTSGNVIIKSNCTLVRLPNGYYTSPFPYSHPEKAWNNLRNFAKWLKSQDVKFFHLIAADKGDDSFGTIPECIPQGYARMAKEYKTFLDTNEIDYLEAKPKLLAQNSNFYYWFYKADHHWNVHAGLLMAEESAKKLNELGVMVDTEVIKKEKFTLKVYPNGFLGSQGRALGTKNTEDMEVYYPKGKTNFHVEIPKRDRDRNGDFRATLFNEQHLSNKTLAYAFCYGGEPLVRIANNNSNNQSRVLVIRLSKADIVCSYLAFAVRYLDVLDPRYFDGSIRTFIEKTRPDAVIYCIDVPWEGEEEIWALR